MLSDVSSLTDLSSDDDSAFVPSNKGKKGKATEYVLKGSLKAPRAVSYSAKHLYEEIMEGRIDLNPEYQRDVVWPDQKQVGLIDSILRNFYVPPVIFALTTTEDGEEKRTCIDGKQRLTSIQRFFDGFIPYKDSRTNVKMWYKLTSSNSKGKLLPQRYRNQFSSKQLVCVEYSDISDDAEREIFQRVQLGVALTPAERMQAIPGPWSQLIREVLNLMLESKMGEHLEWSSSRGRDFQCVATALYLMEKRDTSVKTFPSPLVLDKWLQRVTPPTKIFKERVIDAFCVFRNLVLEKAHSKVFQKPARVSPIEFVMVAVLIDIYMTKYSIQQLAVAISKMRADVRQKHTDVRANSKVTKTMLSFIADKVPGIMKKPENGEKSALQAVRSMPPPSAPNGKRKRARGSSIESESSDDTKPMKSKASPVKKTARTVSGVASSSKAASPAPSKNSVDRMSIDRPATPQASSSRATGPSSASSSRMAVKPASTATTMASTPRPTGSAGMRNDRLAAMRAAKAATSGVVKQQTATPTPPPRAPSRQSTGDASMPPPSTTATLTGVDMSAVQNALQRTATGQMMVDAQSWPGQVPQAQTQMSTMYNQLHQQQQQQQQQQQSQPQPQPQQFAQQTQPMDPRMHPSRLAALGLPNGTDQSLAPRGVPHPEQQQPPFPYQAPNIGSFSGPPPAAGGGAVPPRHRERISRFDWQADAKTNGGGP